MFKSPINYSVKENIQPKYRKDIDGLRALAVILVVFFHGFPEWLPGGFIGVDIFFVISGFLISTILLENLEKNSFSFTNFYARRIRRIFPALIVVLSFALIVGWFALFPDEYRLLGWHIFSSASFFQNLNLLSEVGYFDEAAETKPLLHLWSLGIEEQFYLIWPLLLWLGYKLKANLLLLTVIIGLSSFGLNLIYSDTNQTFAFFSPLTRFWELLLGGVLAYSTLKIKPNLHHKNLSLVGIGLIAIGAITITSASTFPGWLALLPTFGAFFIIAASEQELVNRYLLSNKVMVYLGLISYPLYLWHWVLLSFIRITESGEVTQDIRLGAVTLALLLAILTYHFIEKPIQSSKFSKQKTIALIILMLLVAFIGFNFYKRDGLSFRAISYKNVDSIFVNYLKEAGADRQEGFIEGFTCQSYEQKCHPHHSNNKKILVWGDSHAQMLGYGIKKILPQNWQFLLITQPGCKPAIILNLKEVKTDCERINFFASEQINQSHPEIVLLSQRDSWDPSKVDLLYENLIKMGVKKVLYLGKSPEWNAKLPKIIYRTSWRTPPKYSKVGLNLKALKLDLIAKDQFQANPRKQYIDLIDLLCNTEGCLIYIGADIATGITSFDTNHLSPAASEYVAKELLMKYLD